MSCSLTDAPSYGTALLGDGRTRFRLWAPDCEEVGLEIDGQAPIAMHRLPDGWFEAEHSCGAGTRYNFRVSNDLSVPDPAARAQSGDVHDQSVVVDPDLYVWQNRDWTGRPWHEAVIYELHVGAFGGFAGVTAQLPYLAELGVTIVELMPIADFPGERNWGYDGVLLYAPDVAYGSTDELKQLIDTAHGLGLMVMLDVVYNHFGPNGNYLSAYASGFYRHDRTTPWGDALDFRRPEVCQFFVQNAIYWLNEYRFDGLRFDAVHAIDDKNFLLFMEREIRAAVAPERHIHLVLENENHDVDLLRPQEGAAGYDGQWADDLHHCIHVMLTGEREAYYEAYADAPAKLLARCLMQGFAFGRKKTPIAPSNLPMTAFVICLQNHDQIGNRAFGERLHTLSHPEALRAATVLLLMAPQIPLMFMGQEWASTAPFLYFASHEAELAEAVRAGRQAEFGSFGAFADPAAHLEIPDPNNPNTYQASLPNMAERSLATHADWYQLHRRLLHLRRDELMPLLKDAQPVSASVLGSAGVRAIWRMSGDVTLTIAVNFGETAVACPPPEGRVLMALVPRSEAGSLSAYGAEVTLSSEPAGSR